MKRIVPQVIAILAALFAALNVTELLTLIGPKAASIIGAGAALSAALMSSLGLHVFVFPRWIGAVAALTASFGALNTAGMISMIGPTAGSICMLIGTIGAALAKGLRFQPPE